MPFKIDDLMIDVLSEPRGRARAGRGNAGYFVDTPPTPLTPITPVAATAASRAAEEVLGRAEVAAMRRGGAVGRPNPDDDTEFPPWVTPRIRQLEMLDPRAFAELKAQLRERGAEEMVQRSGSSQMPGPDDDISDFPPWVTPRIRQLDLLDPHDLAELKAQLAATMAKVEALEARAHAHLEPKSLDEVEALLERLRGAVSSLEERRAMLRGERTS